MATPSYCWDIRWNIYFNQKKTIFDENGENPYVKYFHSLCVTFEIQDENKIFINFVNESVDISNTDVMLSFDQKLEIFNSEFIRLKIDELIKNAKLKYANYIQ
ncbi:MAG: hypothetical protein EOL93_12055 [Epsilonproteobacteria bacterium]|nr:hypothetical protein [Campylobacterota bacterium]